MIEKNAHYSLNIKRIPGPWRFKYSSFHNNLMHLQQIEVIRF